MAIYYKKKENKFPKNIQYITSPDGKFLSVILNIEDWENIVETLEIMSKKEFMESINRAKKELKNSSKLLTHQEVFKNLQ